MYNKTDIKDRFWTHPRRSVPASRTQMPLGTLSQKELRQLVAEILG